ncbi:MAG: hypothetical protein JWL90_434 [Chthoniobacteraceae bacterium]|nr:hypothetical protein [Chthoniobacteraceae bacterium]
MEKLSVAATQIEHLAIEGNPALEEAGKDVPDLLAILAFGIETLTVDALQFFGCVGLLAHRVSGFAIVATGEIFFHPDINANKEVAAPHFLDL